MPALLEQRSGMGAHKHHALVSSNQRDSFLRLDLREPLPLLLQVQVFESLGSVPREPVARRAKERFVVEGGERRDGLGQLLWKLISPAYRRRHDVQQLVFDGAPGSIGPPLELLVDRVR
jgi:hypothetical protein